MEHRMSVGNFAITVQADGLGQWRASLVDDNGKLLPVGAFASLELARAAAERNAEIASGLIQTLSRKRRRTV